MSYTPKPSTAHPGWVEVPGYPYFLANRQGKVRNAKTGYETYGSLDDKGYRRVCQWDNDTKTKKEYKAHQIVCAAFHGPRPSPSHEVGHKDDNRANNAPGNLQWITRKDNMTKANKKRISTESRRLYTACLITGNPKYIHNNSRATAYYADIIEHLEMCGFEVTVDPGDDYTCPPKSDLYVGHSRGVSRYICVEDDPSLSWRFLKFGDIDGITHPKDRQYQKKYQAYFGTDKDFPAPPKEHYVFTNRQRVAITDLADRVKDVSLESIDTDTAYVARTLTETSQALLADLQARLGLHHPIPPDELHLTLMYSPTQGIPNYRVNKRPLVSHGGWVLEHLGDDQQTVAIVLQDDDALQARHSELLRLGGVHTYTPYMAHISLSYDDHISDAVHDTIVWTAPRTLTFIKEYIEAIKDDVTTESVMPISTLRSLSW